MLSRLPIVLFLTTAKFLLSTTHANSAQYFSIQEEGPLPSSGSKGADPCESIASTLTLGSAWEDSPGRIQRRAERLGRVVQYGVKRVDSPSTHDEPMGESSSESSPEDDGGHHALVSPTSQSLGAAAQTCWPQKAFGDVFIDLFFHMRLWNGLPTCMSKEPDGLTVLKDALGLMGLSDPKPLKSPLTSVKTHPIQPPQWFGPLAIQLLQSEPPLVVTRC